MATDPSSTDPAPAPPAFDALPALAHVELDRFCGQCGYNLRGQPVRKDPTLHVLLCRCPECGSFTAANDAPLVHRGLSLWQRQIIVIGWTLLAASLLLGPIGMLMGVMLETTADLVRMKEYEIDDRIKAGDFAEVPFQRGSRWGQRRLALSMIAIAGAAAIGMATLMLWTVAFPHWRRPAYRMMAIAVPALCAIVAATLVAFFSRRGMPDDWPMWVLFFMAIAAMFFGQLGALIGRPVARFAVAVLLPPALRPAMAFLWLADGKTPPHAK